MDSNKKNAGNRKSTTYDVYVGHVPKTLPKGKIEQFFSRYGVLLDVLYRFGNGSYGYAIVKFKYQKEADTVLRNVGRVNICGHEMDVKKGRINNQHVENVNGATTVPKTVPYPEPNVNIPPVENSHFLEPVSYDANYSACVSIENEPLPLEIMCTYVENAITFYGCILSRFEELQNLSLKLNSICPNLQRLLRKPLLKKVYGSLFEDMAWYRCFVIQSTIPSKPGLCIVQYIDFGNIAEVCYTNMVELPEPLKNIPPFAAKCVFSNLVCGSKSHNNITYLHHLINQRMSLCALPPWEILEYQVLKCSCNGIDVIGELVRNGFAAYKTQMAAKSPPLPNKPNKITNTKSQENHKPKKASTSKTHKKVGESSNSNKIKDECNDNRLVTDACNGVNGPSEINNNEKIEDHEMTKQNLSSDESQHAQEFIPTKIIKRGDITDVVNEPVNEQQQQQHVPALGAKTVNHMLMVDSVIANVKLVNNIRGLFPFYADDEFIINAINLLQNEIRMTELNDTKNPVEEAHLKYLDSLNELKNCHNQDILADLKKKRDDERLQLLGELKHFFEIFDYSLIERRKKIQEIITALESNSDAWMNVYLSKSPETVEDLLMEYNQEKENKKNTIQRARENSNAKHKNFQKFLEDLQKEFSLNMVDGNADETYYVNTGGIRGSWDLKFKETLVEYYIALEQEKSISIEGKDKSHISVIDCILKKIDIPKEKIDAECVLFEKYKTLFDDLNFTFDLNPIFEELYALRKNIQVMSSNCVFNGDSEKMNNMLLKLHTALLQEDDLLQKLAKASVLNFPELILEHPDLKLAEYQEHSNLMKFSWEDKFFPHLEKCNRIEPSYVSKLADEPVVIKEFKFFSVEDKKAFMKKTLVWNEIRSNFLVKLKAVFSNKDEDILYSLLPPVWETLYDNPLPAPVDYKSALELLQKILEGLRDIHSRGIAHGAVHPLAILRKDKEVLLDFNFDRKYLGSRFCLNGINFQVPSAEDMYKSADMYGFGCLVLWVLFPNLSFSSTDQGIPNLGSFQSIIEELLTAKDFKSLCALLNVNQDLRPSSQVLLSNGFLKDLRIMS